MIAHGGFSTAEAALQHAQDNEIRDVAILCHVSSETMLDYSWVSPSSEAEALLSSNVTQVEIKE